MNTSVYMSLHVLQSVTVRREGNGRGTTSDVTYCIVPYLFDFPTRTLTVVLSALSFTTVQYTVFTVLPIPYNHVSCFVLCSALLCSLQRGTEKRYWDREMWRSPRYSTVRPYGTDGKWVVRPFFITQPLKIRFLPFFVPKNSNGPYVHPSIHPCILTLPLPLPHSRNLNPQRPHTLHCTLRKILVELPKEGNKTR